MNLFARHQPSQNSAPPCPDLLKMAERELSAFFNAISGLFGLEQAELSAEEWLQELMEIDALPTSAREWQLFTAKVSTRLARRVGTSCIVSS